MYQINETTQYRKDLKKAEKQHKNLVLLKAIIDKLIQDEPLDAKYNLHQLSGNWYPAYECHINPDWLLIFLKTDDEEKNIHVITLIGLGSHSYLFNL